ncbi:hypothetical protein Hs30E_12890 [Lactococcus hodotermopsidis]|uniref:Phage protein n=1 Tax=Pseudolactococcus hodotermopsidis TaxID=2709157 RepID=A0A6A0BEI2_9LACT|nr:hypothetical protein [Lactococcus hodotermopsidis]GFH42738.1 hypothetical protein Hs30E_12890 [Lactococcus hodotermopsidis]
MKDMMTEVFQVLSGKSELADVVIKSFEPPETLTDNASSIVIVPVGSPEQAMAGSDKFLAKRFVYQINVETSDRIETKRLAKAVEGAMLSMKFVQLSGGLDEYFSETKRYVDARRYVGVSKLYADY